VDENVDDGSSFYHYFAESELLKLIQNHQPVAVVDDGEEDAEPVAFDGMSCVAFKLDQLKMGQQAQRLAAFEASRTAETNNE
jgi:hypothetical protein